MPIGRTQGSTQDTVVSFLVQSHPGNGTTHELNITIPYNLYQYYSQKSHFLFSPQDFSRFVTPYTFRPVADRLWQIYNNTEDYANAVLALVHQINYVELEPSRYPVETLVAGQGDCDQFVYIAASILEAGGVPTVILYYQNEMHMELAVDLGSEPVDARSEVYSVIYQGTKYYLAEATGGSWRQGWRVGECPSDYQNATSQVIAPLYMEQSSIGQVSASLRELDPSILTLQLSTSIMLQNSQVTLTGQILPIQANENVTLQGRNNGGSWFTVGSAQTDADGKFSFSWVIQTEGLMEVQASWIGNRQLNGASSAVVGVYVVSPFLIAFVGSVAVLCVVLGAAFVVVSRKRRSAVLPVESTGLVI
ncbi:MAG TPA: hypothetical protein VLH35_03315 [Candidatus Acidoferrales bacterium]|nr:hypothetical protein [Candidatus Acidoferrales bacterium]